MDILKQYAMSFVGKPYRWGGNNPITSFDCSGLVNELLDSVGLKPKGDYTAQMLFNYFDPISERNSYKIGALAFYGESVTKINHVAFLLDNYRILEAGGGSSSTITVDDAAKQNAFIRIRLINRRKDLVAVIRPRYSTIGVI